MVLEGENLVTSAKSTGIGLSSWPRCSTTAARRRGDDRRSLRTLATAVAASYMNIPVVHVQGGEVTGSVDRRSGMR